MKDRITVIKQGIGTAPTPLAKCCTGGVGQLKVT